MAVVAGCSAPAPAPAPAHAAPAEAAAAAPVPSPTAAPVAPEPDACADDAGARTAYRAQSKRDLSDDDSCVQRPGDFPGVVLIGDLAADGACRPRGVLIDCHYDASADAKTILARAGWGTPAPEARERLALAYTREIELVGERHEQITSERSPDGGIVVSGAIRSAASIKACHDSPKPRPCFVRFELQFAPNGALTRR